MEALGQLFSNFDALIISMVVLGIIVGIFTNYLSPSQAFLSGTVVLILARVVHVDDLLVSFSNTQVITIFILIYITVAIREHVDISALFDKSFPQHLSQGLFLLKLSAYVALFSSFLNNTPIVAMLTANVQQWARKKNISSSKLLIPLSFAAIIGGMITVIGTSTNLVLQGLLSSNGEDLLSYKDFAVVGSVVSVAGIIFLSLFSSKLLPDRKIAIKQFADNRGEYIHEVELEDTNDLIGKSVADAGLKNLQGIYLIEIFRNNEAITPVAPDVLIEKGDHFYIAGDTELLVEYVRNKNGLMLSSEFKLQKGGEGDIVEVLVAANSKLSGLQVKDSNFRESYNASIIGIHRNGEKISGKIGHVKLKSGDLLLLLTGADFSNRIAEDKNLYLLSELKKAFSPPVVKGKWLYGFLQLATIAIFSFQVIDFFLALFLSLFLLISFNFLTIDSIKRNFNFDLLIVLACSLTIGKAFIDSGAAEYASTFFLDFISASNPKLVLFALFVFTVILTTMITNVAAVSIAFPVAFALAHDMDMSGAPFYLTIAFAASAAFLTPMAYQTNMMVYGPGGYKSTDFLKIGLPMLLVYSFFSLFMIYLLYDL